MSVLVANSEPTASLTIAITTAIDSSEELILRCNGEEVDEVITVKHRREQTTEPVVVPISITAPGEEWTIDARHVLDNEEVVVWSQESPSRCSHIWAETGHEYAVEVVARSTTSSGETKKKMVYIKVRPEPDLPD